VALTRIVAVYVQQILIEQRFTDLLAQIYSAVAELETMFPGRHFTPDGHMVGSIGEAIAAYHYGIDLHRPGHKVFDGRKNGKQIQIKTTQRNGVDLKHGTGTLLVLKLEQNGDFKEIYNGNADRVWKSLAHRPVTDAGEIHITLNKLRALQREVQDQEKIARAA
jgi:hypothetical protein